MADYTIMDRYAFWLPYVYTPLNLFNNSFDDDLFEVDLFDDDPFETIPFAMQSFVASPYW